MNTTDATVYDEMVRILTYKFEGTFSPAEVAESVAVARADLERTAKVTTYHPILTQRLARERLLAAAQADGRAAKELPELLFLCVQNAGRSQMAAALAMHLAPGKVHVRTAGSNPADKINPDVVAVLAERGISLDEAFPKPISDAVVRAADVIITMGCGDACPIYPGKRYEDWPVADPAGASLDTIRDIRDDIQNRVVALLRQIGI